MNVQKGEEEEKSCMPSALLLNLTTLVRGERAGVSNTVRFMQLFFSVTVLS